MSPGASVALHIPPPSRERCVSFDIDAPQAISRLHRLPCSSSQNIRNWKRVAFKSFLDGEAGMIKLKRKLELWQKSI